MNREYLKSEAVHFVWNQSFPFSKTHVALFIFSYLKTSNWNSSSALIKSKIKIRCLQTKILWVRHWVCHEWHLCKKKFGLGNGNICREGVSYFQLVWYLQTNDIIIANKQCSYVHRCFSRQILSFLDKYDFLGKYLLFYTNICRQMVFICAPVASP